MEEIGERTARTLREFHATSADSRDSLREMSLALAEHREAVNALAAKALEELKIDRKRQTPAELRGLLRAVQDYLGPRVSLDLEGASLVETLEASLATEATEATEASSEPLEAGAAASAAAAADARLDAILEERLRAAKVGVLPDRARPLEDRCQWVTVPPTNIDPRDAIAPMEESDLATHPCDPLRARVVHFERLDIPGTWLCMDVSSLMEYLQSQDPRVQPGEPLPRNVKILHPLKQPALSAVVDMLQEQHRRYVGEAAERGELVDETPKQAFPDFWEINDIQRIRDYYLMYRAAWGVCRASKHADLVKFLAAADRFVPADRVDDPSELPPRSWTDWLHDNMSRLSIGFMVVSILRIVVVVTVRSVIMQKRFPGRESMWIADFLYTLLGSLFEFLILRAMPVLGLKGGNAMVEAVGSLVGISKFPWESIMSVPQAETILKVLKAWFGWIVNFDPSGQSKDSLPPVQLQVLKALLAIGGPVVGVVFSQSVAERLLVTIFGDSILRRPTTLTSVTTLLISAAIVLFVPRVVDWFTSDIVEVAKPFYSLIHNAVTLGVFGQRATSTKPFAFEGRIPLVGKWAFEQVLGLSTGAYTQNPAPSLMDDLALSADVFSLSGLVSVIAGGDLLALWLEAMVRLTVPGSTFKVSRSTRAWLRSIALAAGLARMAAQAVLTVHEIMEDFQTTTQLSDRYSHLVEENKPAVFEMLRRLFASNAGAGTAARSSSG